MKRNRWTNVFTLCLFTLSFAACSSPEPAVEPEPAPGPDVATTPQEPPIQQVQSAAAGQIESIDTAAGMLTIKTSDGAFQTFSYSEATEIVGAENAQGLAARQGNDVIVSYAEQADRRMALRIEIVPR